MELPLTGYHDVRLLRASRRSRVFEAVRRADGLCVIAKVFDLGPEDIELRAEHEFAVLAGLDVEGVVRALGLQRVGEQLVLLLERAPGMDLASYAKGRALELERFTAIAIAITEILARVHERRIIHRDIKPTNIVIDPDSGQVALADFGISVLLESERRHIYDPAVLEGTLPYLSPEQTGRTARPVDFRSDLYSLGVTFYELLTGRLPFVAHAPLELIHAHLARMPVSPQLHRPDLPDGFARLVLKLLAKAPEHRYQTARGLAADLRQLRVRLAAPDHASFVLGREDFPRELQLPHQLYGRQRERERLDEELAAVVDQGHTRVTLLSGPAGIGKSALLHSFEAEVARLGSYVAYGRFHGSHDRPHGGFIEAFSGLVEQLLTESEARLASWRERLREALGGVARVLTDLLPPLELIIGEQPELDALEPAQARNRVQLALARFASVFCSDGRPLIVVLEDLQWTDPGSLTLLEVLSEAGRRWPMLILASVRPADADEDHPLWPMLARLPEHRLSRIQLGPLATEAVEQLLADSLARSPTELHEFSRIIARKTDNNPLFIRQLLTHFSETGLLTASERGWTWELAALEAAGVPDDALEVMQAKLAILPPESSTLLLHAACIGARFDLATLALICERPAAALIATLYELVDAGLLNHFANGSANGYAFTHHSIWAAALAQADPERRRRLRWTTGLHRLARLGPGSNEELSGALAPALDRAGALAPALDRAGALAPALDLFEIVDHLNAGLPADLAARSEPGPTTLAQLNLQAGRLALDSAAHELALRYLEQGIELVAELREAVARDGPSAPHYALLVDLHFDRAQALAAHGGPDAAESGFRALLQWALGPRDDARVAGRWIVQLNLAGRNDEAVEFGLKALARHGCAIGSSLPGLSTLRMRMHLSRAWRGIRAVDAEQLLAMPDCKDERAGAVMELLGPTKSAAYLVDPKLYIVLISAHVRWLLGHGRHPGAALALTQLATCVAARLGEVEGAIGLAERAMAFAAKVELGPTRVQVESAAQLFVIQRGRPFAEPLARLDGIYGRALDAGDFLWAGYTGALGLSMHLEVGTHLQVLRRLAERFDHDLGSRASQEASVVAATLRGLVTLLAGAPDEAEQANARASLDPARVEASGASRYSIYVTVANQAMVALLLGRPRAALDACLRILDSMERVLFASWVIPRVAMIALIALAQVPNARPARRLAAVRRRAHAIIRDWAAHSPANYAHYRDLAGGLRLARRPGSVRRRREALDLLERARAHAAAQGCRWIEGLAAEQLAELAELDGLSGFANGARKQAFDAYAAWGANAKLAQLRRLHAGWDEPPGASSTGEFKSDRLRTVNEGSSSTPARSDSASALDFDSVLRSVAAIGADLRLDQVNAAVLDAAIANAGADRGALVLEQDGAFVIAAFAVVDEPPSAERLPLSAARDRAPTSLIHFVLRTGQAVIVDDVSADARFCDDPYLRHGGGLSLLGLPIIKAKRTLGALVVENRLSRSSFTRERLEVLQLIAGQAASALEHGRIHDALREGEARWRSLVDGVPDMIALLDERGQIEFVNRSGQRSELGPGAPVFELLARSPTNGRWHQALTDVMQAGVTPDEFELELPRERGSSRWYTVRLAPIEVLEPNEGGLSGPRKAIAIATDITARKQAEAANHQLEAQVRQQQRLESVGTLASGVAHEINNPIQGIMNYAELIADHIGDTAMIREFAGEIITESDRVATIVRNLLAFSRHEGEAPNELTVLDELVRGTLSLIRSVMRRDQIELRVELPASLPPVRCRPQQIQQIIMNLVTNARDAIRTEPDAGPSWLVIRAELPRPGWIHVIVEDSGPGIDAGVLPRIFDPFFTTKGRDQGTGLGLAVSHGIAREHGGELRVESPPGRGARFILELPLDAAHSP